MFLTYNANAIIYKLLISKVVIDGAEFNAEDGHFKLIIIKLLQIILRPNIYYLHCQLIADSLEFAVRIEYYEIAFCHNHRFI